MEVVSQPTVGDQRLNGSPVYNTRIQSLAMRRDHPADRDVLLVLKLPLKKFLSAVIFKRHFLSNLRME